MRSWRSRWASSWSKAPDLFVQNDTVYMRTTHGPQRVHVIYRRVDDDFLDPLAFRPTRCSACPGLFGAYRAGQRHARQRHRHRRRRRQVDLSVRAGDDPLLPVRGADARQRPDVPAAQAGGSRRTCSPIWRSSSSRKRTAPGGYGMLIGPAAAAAELDAFRRRDHRGARQVHRAADACAVDLPDVRRKRARAAPRRPAPVRAVRQDGEPRARRAHARRAARGLAGRQLVAGRRDQGHLGAGQLAQHERPTY